MSTPPPIDELAANIARAHPFARVEIEAPLLADGIYHIDIRLGDQLVVVEWSAMHGYGISLVTEAALGAAPDVRMKTPDEVLEQVAAFLKICGIVDESGVFTCRKAWGHDEPIHTGMRRAADGSGHGKSWLADDEEHTRRLALKRDA